MTEKLMNKIEKSDGTVILVVDDQLENLQLLGHVLRSSGYRVAVANRGPEALAFVEKVLPDLILLDIMMPKMDGFEVCDRMKKNPRTKEIPIVFLTAKNLTEDLVKGFRIGGIDYVTKPFNPEELLVRIRTHIDLKHSKDIILKQNEMLKKLNNDKNTFLSIAAHDLKNPVNVILGFSRLMIDKFSQFQEKEIIEFLKDIKFASEGMFRIISDMIDINRIDENTITYHFSKFDICKLVDETLVELKEFTNRKSLDIYLKNNSSSPIVYADRNKTQQVLDNLINNAIKFSPEKKNIWINISDEIDAKSQKRCRIEIKDEGPGIKEEEKELLFQKMMKLSAKPTLNEPSTGLGLAIAKGLTDGMSGKIWCESNFGNGAGFYLEFPSDDYQD